PLAHWFWADARQGVPGLSLALMALMLALAANLGVGTMVGSFRATFTGWLNQRLVAELYLTLPDAATAARALDMVAPQVEAVLPIWRAEAMLAGQPGQVYGVADHATYRDHWPLLSAVPGVWDVLARGQGALVNEQLARRAGLALGDAVDLPGGALPVLGVYSDYGNPRPQVMVAVGVLTARFADVPRLRYALRLPPDRAADLARRLRADLALPEEAVVDQAAVKALSLAVFDRTFAVTAALNVLTLGVAGVALVSSLVTLSALRLGQLAPLWALGVARGPLARLEVARLLALAALTFALALPLGLALAWALLAVVNVQAFGWRLPMQVFPADWLRLLALALLAAGLAALWPARRLARATPAELLRRFAGDR
ncbi:MAG: ABC transporter permease, partial [Rhodobacterales bacterium]|nr:ABC transporter permease [Rhodobacterales bacterium]